MAAFPGYAWGGTISAIPKNKRIFKGEKMDNINGKPDSKMSKRRKSDALKKDEKSVPGEFTPQVRMMADFYGIDCDAGPVENEAGN
ncbi:hypothetical protein UR09_03790 [Candidatus Nitromaritima sp. SCGC AAA799-A02]|nr:hypothetical protein UR09_03790 [Candidatus Nitromaritima sp. SCGC AAA799-A02]KMP12192.1 hypothetical protein UZ36_01895 [Candidatus Nitromaritima sp. SCGC AAA799-C22]